jgi:uncharacterized protein (UPF0276 family)
MINVGLGYRRSIRSKILAWQTELDCLEIISEQFTSLNKFQVDELTYLSKNFKIIPHGLRLSIGSVARPQQTYLDSIARILEITDPPYYSDHFAFTGTSEIDIGHLSPLWYTDQYLEIVINNVTKIQSFLGLPLVLETITHPFFIPKGDMSQCQFIKKVCSATNCGILLDITNVFINSKNLGEDAKKFIKSLPLESIQQIHLVGYSIDASGFFIDSHSEKIQKEIWKLYEYALSVCSPKYVVIERDLNFPEDSELIQEVGQARSLAKE